MKSRPKHDWNSWENYLTVHEKTLKKYIDHYYVSGPTEYEVSKLTDQHYELALKNLILRSSQGSLIEFKIEKTVELDIEYSRPRARTFGYSYHALTPKPKARNLMRYCSPHEHRPIHHKHIYYPDGSFDVIEVAVQTWPHVSEFFDEVLQNF